MGREPMIYVGVGQRGIGKTVTTTRLMREYVRGNPAQGVPGRNVLIFDVNNEFSDPVKFPDFRSIRMKDVPKFAQRPYPEIRRITPFYDNGRPIKVGQEMIDVLAWILDNFYNGLLLVEDINKYVSDNMPHDLIGALCTNRHLGMDLILHYQSIGRVATKVWQNIDVLRMHKETGGVERNRNKFEDKYEMFKLAENIINQEYSKGNIRFFVTVDIHKKKIKGNMSMDCIKDAINEYIWQDNKSIITRALNQRNRLTQETIYKNEKEAYFGLEKYFLERYFDIA